MRLDKQGSQLTEERNDLSLQPVLALEAARKIRDAAFAIASYVGDLADLVEHVAAGEEEDRDEGDCGPQVAVLRDGQQVRANLEDGADDGQARDDGDDDLDPVDWPRDGRVRAAFELPREPGVDGLCFLVATSKVVAEGLGRGGGVRAGRGREEQENRSSLEAKLFLLSVSIRTNHKSHRVQAFRDVLTDMNVSRPSLKSSVPKTVRDSAFLSPLTQLEVRMLHSGWKSWQSWQAKRASRAVRRTAAA